MIEIETADLDAPRCPECNEFMLWRPCEGRNGRGCTGFIRCSREGMEGGYYCPDCEDDE